MSRPRWRDLAIRTAADIDDPVAFQAAEWRVALAGDPDAGVLARFEAWKAKDRSHAETYALIATTELRIRTFRDDPDLLGLRHETLARASLGRRRRQLDRKRLFGAMAAAVALSLAPLALWVAQVRTVPPEAEAALPAYATSVGQRMILTLEDGSQVTLNTASRLRVAYTDTERRLYLDAGQAWFKVAHDADKPFNVIAGSQQVTAHGTQFDVRLKPDAVQVLLVEGKVSVAPRHGGARAASAMLSPNDMLTVDASGVQVRRVADTGAVEGWREGVVVFDDTPLAEAVEEINRYATRPFVLTDGRAGRVRVSGVYRIGGEAVFAEALEEGLGVSVDRGRPDRIGLSARR